MGVVRRRIRVALIFALAVWVAGCAFGTGVNDRGDGGPSEAGSDAAADARSFDADPGCIPPCRAGDLCVSGRCIPNTTDEDSDGISVAQDCDDADPSVGTTAERACSTSCGSGVERCSLGVWGECDAPTECSCPPGSECTPGEVEMGATCGFCGRQERVCQPDCTFGAPSCVDEGTCMAGALDAESRACPGTCGNMQTRERECDPTSCEWGPFDDWRTCAPCGPTCGDGMCEAPETCGTCADCQYGHQGPGEGNTPCAGVPAEQWRCVNSANFGTTLSQVCRGGVWVNFHLTPQDCAGCVCSYSTACRQAGT